MLSIWYALQGSWTALILASRKAHYKVVEHLVNNGADVLIQNWVRQSIHSSSQYQNWRLRFQYYTIIPQQGWSALMWAANCPGKNNQTEEALGNRVKTAEILISKDRSIMDIPANVCSVGIRILYNRILHHLNFGGPKSVMVVKIM